VTLAQFDQEGAPKAWLGVSLSDPEPPVDDDEETPQGALVVGVVKESPADEAGLRAGDLIVQVDAERVASARALIELIGARDPGGWVDLEIVRRGERRHVSARLAPRPQLLRRLAIKRGFIGLTPLDVPRQLREFWGGSETSGVLAAEVEPGGPADIGGIDPGDLILAIDGHEVGNARDLITRVRRSGIGNKIEIELSRQGVLMTVEVRVEEQPPQTPRSRHPGS